MRLILLGPAGAGKGTQGRLLSDKLRLPHISTGEILRHEIEEGTELGKQAKRLIDNGNFVSDEIVNAIVHGRISQPDAHRGFILDGYPRTVPQAIDLEAFLKEYHQDLNAVFDLEVDEAEIIRRLSERRICSGCGEIYHLSSYPPLEAGKCDKCGSSLLHREDDEPDAIRRRMLLYRRKTQPLIDFYRERKKLVPVDARNGVELTFDAISHHLGLDPESPEETL